MTVVALIALAAVAVTALRRAINRAERRHDRMLEAAARVLTPYPQPGIQPEAATPRKED